MYYDFTDITIEDNMKAYLVDQAHPGQGFYWNSDGNFQIVRRSFDKTKNNMKLEITKEKVLEAASKCPTAKETLKTLFPEAFAREKVNNLLSENHGLEWRQLWNDAIYKGLKGINAARIPGRDYEEKVDSVILALAEKFNWS